MLDSLESKYKKKSKSYIFHNWNSKIHYPINLIFDDNNTIIVDFLSSLRSIEKINVSSENIESLRNVTSTKLLNNLNNEIIKNFSLEVDITKDIPDTNDITENILSSNIFYSIAYIYKDLLDNFYNMQYLVTHYIKVSWSDFLKMTPLETTILYKNFIEDKEKQNEKSKSNNILNHVNSNMLDL